MFESLTYKNGIGPGPLIDIGALAEGLIFYGRVVVVGNTATIKDLLAQIPPYILLILLRERRLEFYYLGDQVGISTTQAKGGRDVHNLLKFSSLDHTIEKVGGREFLSVAGNSGQAKLAAKRFTRLIKPFDHSGFNQESVIQGLGENCATEQSAKAVIQTLVPEFPYPKDFRFSICREAEGIIVDTNLDFAALNTVYHLSVPTWHSSISEAYILALIQGAYEAAYYAASLNTEIAVHPIDRAVVSNAVESIVGHHQKNQTEVSSFTDLVLDDTHQIRNAVNSGAVPFSSVLRLLDSADRFREWLKTQPSDTNLVKAYYQETIKDSWVDKLPGKSMRWTVFTGLGLGLDIMGAGGLGTAAGVALSAMDSFLLDSILKGWKPHQFVESDLNSTFSSRPSSPK